jgi:hypothetical protein
MVLSLAASTIVLLHPIGQATKACMLIPPHRIARLDSPKTLHLPFILGLPVLSAVSEVAIKKITLNACLEHVGCSRVYAGCFAAAHTAALAVVQDPSQLLLHPC